MNFISLFEKYDWFSVTWVIHTALERWATLTVNASGNTVPERFYRINLVESLLFNVKYQSPEQREEWDKLTSDFYKRIVKRAGEYEDTFSIESIKAIREYLTNISDAGTDMQHSKIPINTKVAKIQRAHHVKEQLNGLHIAEYMLQLDQANALSFLEKLSVYWAANSGSNSPIEQGRYLYFLAEQLE